MSPQTQDIIDKTGHTAALASLTGWFVGVLPTIATLFTVLWFGILIVEKITGKPFSELVQRVCRRLFS